MKKLLFGSIVLVTILFGAQAWAEESERKVEFKQDFHRVKDQKKKEAVDKITKELVKLNSRKLERFGQALDQMEGVLTKILGRAEKQAQKGFNIEKVRMAVEEARTAIAASRSAVEVQGGKVYKIEASSEEGLKDAVKKVRRALHDDLKAVQNTVKAAREAIKGATVSLARVKQEGRATPIPSSTSSPSASPSPSVAPN